MSKRQDRTDRVIIAIALIILLLAGGAFYFDEWMWGARRTRGERIGVISAKNGDVRVKFEGDLKWGRAARGQDLIYNDAIYAGEGSQADLALGNSRMTVDSNTLIVLRRENDVNFLNLDYGTLFGKVAKGEKIVIETGRGKPIELNTTERAEIVLRKHNGKTELNVISGQATMLMDGQKRNLNRESRLVIDEKIATPKVEGLRLQALKPLAIEKTYSNKAEELPFGWTWSNRRDAFANEKFTLEFSGDPTFNRIHARKEVQGRMSTTMRLSKTLSLFYRVRGPRGELSQVEKVNFVRLQTPVIVRPLAQQKILTPPGQNALVEMAFEKPSEANIWYQIAADSDFQQIMLNQSTRESRKVQELSIGSYFLRARSDYGENRLSDWSPAVEFAVEPELQPLKLTDLPDRNRILIPNRPYPEHLYKAPSSKVREFLADRGFMNNYFPLRAGDFDEIKVDIEGRPSVSQNTPAWPTSAMSPGAYTYKYQVSKLGFQPSPVSAKKKLQIALEPPRALGTADLDEPVEDGSREVRWMFTPLLFAKSYDVEIAGDPSFSEAAQIQVDEPIAKTNLAPGNHYWRARARDGYGRIISDFSAVEKINVPEFVPRALAANDPDPIADEIPRAAEKTVMSLEKSAEEDWVRNGWWAWAGSGMNYVDYRQSIQSRGAVTSHSPKGPSQYLEAGYNGKSGWGGVLSFKTTPGEITVPNANVDNGAYTWSTLSLEGIMRRKSPVPVFGSPLLYGLRVGVQQHKTPFLFLDADTNLQLKENVMKTASFGLLAEVLRKRWTYYWLMRYQYPFSSEAEGSNQFEITPTFAFDGSVGASYNLTQQLKLGLFWYGQWHQYNFVYGDSQITNTGFQSLFYSNIDVRLGFDF